MPRGDRTGPEGRGSMTGRGAGFCSGNKSPGYMNTGFGGGRGFGRGFRTGYSNTGTQTKEEQKTALETNLKDIEAEKQEIERRLKELS